MADEQQEDQSALKPHFGVILNEHLHKLCSVHEVTPLIMWVMSGIRGTAHKKRSEFLDEHGEVVREEEDSKHYVVPLSHTGQMKAIDRRQRRAETAFDALPPSFVVALVSEYDAFLGQLIAEAMRVKPELLNASDRNISFSDLQQYGSIDEAREHILEKEVESVLRKSHADQFSWLEKKLGIPLTKGLESWPVFIELTERRNLFVHCDGVVSSQYLQVCSSHKVEVKPEVALGNRLGASREYLRHAYECLYEISVKLTHVIWRKLLPESLEEADAALIHTTYDLLDEKQNRLAANILRFSVDELKKWGSEVNRRVLVINYAQSFYHRGDKDQAKKILSKEDWSACSDDFRLCEATLRDDYEQAFSIMRAIGKDGAINENSYINWPVFRELRKQPEFCDVYEEIFGEPPVNYAEIEADGDEEEVDDNESPKPAVH